MKLSYLIATRNDDFCGNPMERLRLSVQQALHVSSDTEVVIADWGSAQPVSEVLGVSGGGRIRHLYVPPAVTSRFATPFSEVHCLNLAARRAAGYFVARLDQDILVGQRFVEWFARHDVCDPRAWFSERRNLAEGQLRLPPTLATWDTPHDPVLIPYWYFGPVGILLSPRWLWNRIRGYDETQIQRNHAEHGLCYRFQVSYGLENLGPHVDYDFHHLWHPVIEGRPNNPYREPQGGNFWFPVTVNDERWGLAAFDADITETYR